MSASFRRLFACLLLVLLPFQAIAAGFAAGKAPVVACSAAMMAEMDCCDDDGGCTPNACIAAVTAALPATATLCLAIAEAFVTANSVPTLHESYVPEGPQRPPQAPA